MSLQYLYSVLRVFCVYDEGYHCSRLAKRGWLQFFTASIKFNKMLEAPNLERQIAANRFNAKR